MIIPEVEIKNVIDNILKFAREDFANASSEQDTFLYRALGNFSNIERYNFFEQSKKVILADVNNSRRLESNFFFNAKRANIPTIHITLPQEGPGEDGIGLDEGYQETEFINGNEYYPIFTRRFQAKYNVVITSDNTNEVILLYHFLRAAFIPAIAHFEANTSNILSNIKLSGSDVNLHEHLVPPNVFARSLGMQFGYDVDTKDFYKQGTIQELLFTSKAIEKEK